MREYVEQLEIIRTLGYEHEDEETREEDGRMEIFPPSRHPCKNRKPPLLAHSTLIFIRIVIIPLFFSSERPATTSFPSSTWITFRSFIILPVSFCLLLIRRRLEPSSFPCCFACSFLFQFTVCCLVLAVCWSCSMQLPKFRLFQL